MREHRFSLAIPWLVLGLVLVACGPEAWERDPGVQAAKKACQGLDEGERYACIERHAVETLNPDACRLAGIWIDDMCLQAVYEAAADPAICDELYLQGVRPTCRAYYAQALAPMWRYTDPVLGFAAEVPSNWEPGDRTDWLDPLGRSWSSVEFRSALHAYGHQAFNRYGMRVQVGPSTGSTLTETVRLNLSSLVPGFRDQVQMHCCLRVGGEQAIQLLNCPPTRWGNRQIVVLHEEREYHLDFFPLAGLTTATPAGVEAQVAFEAFLRTFTFLPVTTTPVPAVPTITPVPTPTALGADSFGSSAAMQGGQQKTEEADTHYAKENAYSTRVGVNSEYWRSPAQGSSLCHHSAPSGQGHQDASLLHLLGSNVPREIGPFVDADRDDVDYDYDRRGKREHAPATSRGW
jgi:hypothetical protein